MRSDKDRTGQHDIATVSKKNSSKGDKGFARSARGLLIMLGSCVAFLAFLSLLTIAVHFIML